MKQLCVHACWRFWVIVGTSKIPIVGLVPWCLYSRGILLVRELNVSWTSINRRSRTSAIVMSLARQWCQIMTRQRFLLFDDLSKNVACEGHGKAHKKQMPNLLASHLVLLVWQDVRDWMFQYKCPRRRQVCMSWSERLDVNGSHDKRGRQVCLPLWVKMAWCHRMTRPVYQKCQRSWQYNMSTATVQRQVAWMTQTVEPKSRRMYVSTTIKMYCQLVKHILGKCQKTQAAQESASL